MIGKQCEVFVLKVWPQQSKGPYYREAFSFCGILVPFSGIKRPTQETDWITFAVLMDLHHRAPNLGVASVRVDRKL